MASAECSTFAALLSAALSQHHLLGFEIAQLEFHHLEVVKQGMARVNIDVLGISELRCTGMGKFNSDDLYIYYCA